MEITEKNKFPSEFEATLEGIPALKQILQNMKQVVWLLDLNTDQILYVNPAFEIIWGRSCKSFYEDPLILIQSVHPEDRVKVMSSYHFDKNRKSKTQNYRIIRPDDSLRWISADTFLIGEDIPGTAYQVCIALDITEQNDVDETLHKALDRSRKQFTLSRRMSLARKPQAVLKALMSAAELHTAQHAFVLFFESTPAGLSRQVEVVASWSSISNQALSNSNESVIDAGLFEELALLNIFHPTKPVMITQISKDERLSPGIRNTLLEVQIKTVAIFPLVALGNWLGCLLVLYTHEMHFQLMELQHIKILVDQATITLYNLQLLKVEAESRQEAERANEIKTRFLAMISHELRTPLTSIKGFATTLLAEDVAWEPEEQRDFIQTIQQETNRLEELIDHLLDLSRLEAGMLSISPQSHSLQEIIQDALPQLQILTSGQSFNIQLPATLPPVYVDSKRIAQVLVNLVRNAATYSPKGTEITILAHHRKGYVQISVIDQGPGIPPDEHKRVFRVFQQGVSVENSSAQGAGLGLAICKGLVEAHGGRIWIKKKITPGAIISFTIPIAPVHVPAAPDEAER